MAPFKGGVVMDFYTCIFRTCECEEADCDICVFRDGEEDEEEE